FSGQDWHSSTPKHFSAERLIPRNRRGARIVQRIGRASARRELRAPRTISHLEKITVRPIERAKLEPARCRRTRRVARLGAPKVWQRWGLDRHGSEAPDCEASGGWYRLLGLNQRHPAPQTGALPT